MRIFYLLKDAPEKVVDAVTVVVMDRIMGMLALICLAATLVSARYAWLTRSAASSRLMEAVLLILGGGALALVLSLVVASVGVPDRWPVPHRVRDLADAFRQFAKDRRGDVGRICHDPGVARVLLHQLRLRGAGARPSEPPGTDVWGRVRHHAGGKYADRTADFVRGHRLARVAVPDFAARSGRGAGGSRGTHRGSRLRHETVVEFARGVRLPYAPADGEDRRASQSR